MGQAVKKTRVHSCNVLHFGAESRQLWQFDFDGGRANLKAEHSAATADPLPGNSVAKDLRALWQPKVNLAWLPSDQVYLRVVQLPATDPSELQSMIELQLEKLSPLPVAQIVWAMEIVGRGSNSDGTGGILGPGHEQARADLIKAVAAAATRAAATPPEASNEDAERDTLTPDRLDTESEGSTAAASSTTTAVALAPEPNPQPKATAHPTETSETAALELATVVVIIVARSLVEEFLGRLEGMKFLAERLEFPLLHQLLANKTSDDGLWIVPGNVAGQNLCLVGWWTDGILRNINLLRVSAGAQWATVLTEQLTQIAWAGEMEGWVTEPPPCYLLADRTQAKLWEPPLRQWLEAPIEVVPALEPKALAAWNAERVARGETTANLLPPEYVARYHQEFIDGLWMGGLFAAVGVYAVIVLIYFAIVQVYGFQENRLESRIAAISGSYTNALKLKAQVDVLQEQSNLRFAALECWKAATLSLPDGLTLTSLNLQYGKTLTISGTAPTDQTEQITEYNKALRQYHVGGTNGPLLFSGIQTPRTTSLGGPGGPLVRWDFACDLQGKDVP